MKKKLGLVFGIVLFISGFHEFLSTPNNDVVYTYSLVGHLVAIHSTILYIYSLYTSKKKIFIISSAGIIIGFIISLITLYSVYKTNIVFSLGMGFYLMLIAYIIYLISLFIPNESEVKKEVIDIPIDKQYVRGKYILGIKSNEQLSNCECLLTFEDNMLHIVIVKDNKIINYDIDIKIIENISVKKVVLMNQNENMAEDHTMADQMLYVALFGPYGNLIHLSRKGDGNYTKVSYKYVYETEIIYNLNNEKKRIIFQLYQEPNKLFRNIKNK